MCGEFGKGHRKRKALARGQIQSLELTDVSVSLQVVGPSETECNDVTLISCRLLPGQSSAPDVCILARAGLCADNEPAGH